MDAGAAGLARAARRDSAGAPGSGFPRLAVTTPAEWCVGQVARGLRVPRGLAALPDGDLLIAEMGGWNPRRGRLLRVLHAALPLCCGRRKHGQLAAAITEPLNQEE
jgi:glucose/arabinose dehydrogenase